MGNLNDSKLLAYGPHALGCDGTLYARLVDGWTLVRRLEPPFYAEVLDACRLMPGGYAAALLALLNPTLRHSQHDPAEHWARQLITQTLAADIQW
jgi:hypothetical protein